MRSVIVLGAGIIGVTSALHLQRRGWSVAILDRKQPGQETSYGNTGIIQSEALRPYPMPHDWRSLVKIATGRTNDVRYHLRSLPHHLGPLFDYWWHSFPRRYEQISAAYAPLISRAAREHEVLICQSGAFDLVRRNGFRVLHREQAAFDAEIAAAEALRVAYGVKFSVTTARELAQAEPGLLETGLGALHWTEPWTVSDPGELVEAYVKLFERLGGTILRGDAETLIERHRGWSVLSHDGRLEAEAVVVALGPWSPDFLKKLGYRIPMVRKRGYHRHYTNGNALELPLRDAAFGYVIAPMRAGLRVTTGAEFAAPNAKSTPVQLWYAERAARKLVDLGRPVEAEPWIGTRPCMPDMLPVLGQAPRHKGLWMHFGHGHQGLTMGAVSGRLLAELLSGEKPSVEAFAYRPERFST
ncbi:MAG: FAD-binding oxidoreductase [Bradyrhizobium sp.]|nr:FAD-binding oxidoreductase [Bradyrhizobium sp.]